MGPLEWIGLAALVFFVALLVYAFTRPDPEGSEDMAGKDMAAEAAAVTQIFTEK